MLVLPFDIIDNNCQFKDRIEIYWFKLDANLGQIRGPTMITRDLKFKYVCNGMV